MLSNQKLQNSLNEIKEISHMDTASFTAKGKLVAHTEEMPLPEALEQQVVVISQNRLLKNRRIRIIICIK